MELVKNEVTGNMEIHTTAKLVSISDGVVGQTNNGKDYYVGTVEVVNQKGQTKQTSALIFKNNFINRETGEIRMSVGDSYATRIVQPSEEGQSPLVIMSHLVSTQRLSEDDFVFESASVQKEVVA